MQQRDATRCPRGRAAQEALRLGALWAVITTTAGTTEEDDEELLSRLAGQVECWATTEVPVGRPAGAVWLAAFGVSGGA